MLVTGHAGLEGTWLSAWLVSMRADVYGLAHEPSMFAALDIARRVHHRAGDVRDLPTVHLGRHSIDRKTA